MDNFIYLLCCIENTASSLNVVGFLRTQAYATSRPQGHVPANSLNSLQWASFELPKYILDTETEGNKQTKKQ